MICEVSLANVRNLCWSFNLIDLFYKQTYEILTVYFCNDNLFIGLGDTCNTAAECALVTDSKCSTTCMCADGFIQEGTACKIGTTLV